MPIGSARLVAITRRSSFSPSNVRETQEWYVLNNPRINTLLNLTSWLVRHRNCTMSAASVVIFTSSYGMIHATTLRRNHLLLTPAHLSTLLHNCSQAVPARQRVVGEDIPATTKGRKMHQDTEFWSRIWKRSIHVSTSFNGSLALADIESDP